MQRYLLHIAVALLAFFLGTSATLLWVTLRAPSMRDLKVQEPQTAISSLQPSEPIQGGILDGKALIMPTADYPRVTHIKELPQGKVVVRVVVDETGKVISARAISGHPLLRHAAVQAAYEARFAPTHLSGQPVKVTGFLMYLFVAGQKKSVTVVP